jgi:selenocysteine lyase/cysteine desulfurase
MIDASARMRDFAELAEIAYLNTAAEGIPPPAVREALLRYWDDKRRGFAGREAHSAQYERARAAAARLIGLSPEEVAFCSCTSEAYNLLAGALRLREGDEVVANDLDFPSGATPWLAEGCPARLRLWASRDGELDVRDLAPLLNERTRLVQTSLISFHNGHRVDLPAVIAATRAAAPRARIAVDITQAIGRVPLDCAGADIVVSSTHKWILGPHGAGIVGVRAAAADDLTTRAGGWHHLQDAFGAERFTRAVPKRGAASFAVGMPPIASIYALAAALDYIAATGVERIAAHADPLTRTLHDGLVRLGLRPLCRWEERRASGIVAIRHAQSERLHQALLAAGVHAMHHAGRLRLAVHGYNTATDIERCLGALEAALAAAESSAP